MVLPGEIYWADVPEAARRPILAISREELNRGTRVVVIPLTTAQFERRRYFPNCIPFSAGEFGLPRDCIAQAERITALDQSLLDAAAGPLGRLDAQRMRDVIRAIGYVLQAVCEPVRSDESSLEDA